MDTQTVFQAGNSMVVAIPKHLVKELGIKNGQKVVVTKAIDGEDIMIKTKLHRKQPVKGVQKEFKKWLDSFLKEDEELLDELATR